MIDLTRYVAITPARNEAKHLALTVASMVSQTIRPAQWIIVNDGSSDETATVIDGASARHHWITVVHRPDRGSRQPGYGVMDAFYAGFETIACEWDFIVKLDADMAFEREYFARCFEHFRLNTMLGIGGGVICCVKNGELIEETKGDPAFHVRGACKIYRQSCWSAIGGTSKIVGWDTLDELTANMLGWQTGTFRDIKLTHQRMSGGVDGLWKNWRKNGRANYNSGYHPLFMILKCGRRIFRKPWCVGALGLLTGFIGGYLQNDPRGVSHAVVRYVRRQQLNRLMGRKSIWD